jgi:hypothetical protein
MGRISNFQLDSTIESGDKLLGSNTDGSTKNFSLADIAKFLSNTNASGIAGSVPYKYSNTGPATGQMKLESSGLTEIAFPTGEDVSLLVSKFPNGQTSRDTVAVLNTFVGKDVVINQIQDPNVFAVYRVKTVVQVGSTNTYKVTMDYVNGNNDSSNKGFYNNVYFNIIPYVGAQDKDYQQSFVTNDLVSENSEYYLVVNHNLNKFPNLTVKVSTGHVVEVPIKHITKNQSRVYFKGLNSGTVYAN